MSTHDSSFSAEEENDFQNYVNSFMKHNFSSPHANGSGAEPVGGETPSSFSASTSSNNPSAAATRPGSLLFQNKTKEQVSRHAYEYLVRILAQRSLNEHEIATLTSAFSLESCPWTREEDDLLETLLVAVPKSTPDRFAIIANNIGNGKRVEDVISRYIKLVLDLARIQAGDQMQLTVMHRKIAGGPGGGVGAPPPSVSHPSSSSSSAATFSQQPSHPWGGGENAFHGIPE